MIGFYGVLEIILMLGIDLLFMAVLVLLVVPLGFFRQTAFAVLKRNFVGYFSNPTGYVFLCLFVFLTSLAAFWPHQFFASNLANFDQLNKYLPLIMLIYIPAITMSIWSEEKRQGTDELLLTLPTTDIDIVLGKYFAAVFVFTVALLYSQLCNFTVLVILTEGNLDIGLLFSTYLGYWFIGIAMLSVGMVASFLTNNLTIAFVFGVLLNAPLAFFSSADLIASQWSLAAILKDWSLLAKFETFGRGLLGLGPFVYFLSIIILSLYLCMVLIGRRHWNSGKNDGWMWMHYIVRVWSFMIILVGCVILVENTELRRIRFDMSEGRVSTLTSTTKEILGELSESASDDSSAIVIDAFVSDDVPTEYVQTRYELINLLQEFDTLGGNRISVNMHRGMKPFSQEAVEAEERFDIVPVTVQTRSQGTIKQEKIFLGAAFKCGLERVTIPFFEYGMPVEYELIRSINTVARKERKTIGLVTTDAAMLGGMAVVNGNQLQRLPKQAIIDELEKQYNVEVVDPNSPITVWVESDESEQQRLRYDAMLVVQPSSLTPQGMSNLIAAIRQGQPIAIFEDPRNIYRIGPDTSAARGQAAAMQGQGQRPKADIKQLWDFLQIDIYGQRTPVGFQPDVVWQDYNPYPKIDRLRENPEFVFLRQQMPEEGDFPPFNADDPITSGLQELMLPYPGAFSPKEDADLSGLKIEPLLVTGKAGVVPYAALNPQFAGNDAQRSLASRRGVAQGYYWLAARITGSPNGEMESNAAANEASEEAPELNVVYFADADLLGSLFVYLRNQPDAGEVSFRMQNLALVLNTIDSLASVDSYIDIRKRSMDHKTLKSMEDKIEEARNEVFLERQEFEKEFDLAKQGAQTDYDSAMEPYLNAIEEYEKAIREGRNVDQQAYKAKSLLMTQVRDEQSEIFQNTVARLERERDEKIQRIERRTDLEIVSSQNEIKFHTLWVPVVPPLVLSLIVFTLRRLRERMGIAKTRLK